MWDNANIYPKKQSWPHSLGLQGLNPKERAAFILLCQQRHPQTNIASILGLSPEALNTLFDGIFNKLSLGIHRFF